MLAAVLSLLSLAGGASVTFFIMDAPRRRAVELRRRLDDDLDAAERERRDNQTWAGDLNVRDQNLRSAEAALARRTTEFDRRAVSYEDLRAENRLIKADLRNMALLVAQREARGNEVGRERTGLGRDRDDLGRAYLDEVVAASRKGLTVSNYPASKRRVEQALARLDAAGVLTSEDDRRRIAADLQRLYEVAVRAAVEREQQAELRERIRDDVRREREARDAAERAEAERQAIERALTEALARARQSQAQASHAQAQAHAAEIDQLRARLQDAEARVTARTISLAEITKSGFVYVISNLGSFGRDVYKIGLTRREHWQERVDELGSAAVPFPFEVHMVLTSDNAPALEKTLHRAFRKRRVNRTNPRKEFFRVTMDEIAKVVRERRWKVEYEADPEALEYMRSQATTDDEVDEIADLFEEAEAVASPDEG